MDSTDRRVLDLLTIGRLNAGRAWLVNRGASDAVGAEIAQFLATGRPIIPVSFGDSIIRAWWYESVRGVALAK